MKNNFTIETAQTFAALSHPKRLEILQILISALPQQVTFGEVQKTTHIPASTLSHHIKEMENGKIISRKTKGSATELLLNLNHLTNILTNLVSTCCQKGDAVD